MAANSLRGPHQSHPMSCALLPWGACSWWTLGFGEALWEWTLGEVTWGLRVSICMKKGECLLIQSKIPH